MKQYLPLLPKCNTIFWPGPTGMSGMIKQRINNWTFSVVVGGNNYLCQEALWQLYFISSPSTKLSYELLGLFFSTDLQIGLIIYP